MQHLKHFAEQIVELVQIQEQQKQIHQNLNHLNLAAVVLGEELSWKVVNKDSKCLILDLFEVAVVVAVEGKTPAERVLLMQTNQSQPNLKELLVPFAVEVQAQRKVAEQMKLEVLERIPTT